ncbi:hypothetical protein D9756_001312 [Leucocoprinus leucothites]|uniref:Uncharacterized protein n=1 Tax=Leucocoprinus leucothites TaxID=201217 RepID=A0A8H5LID0_9AGAR|nr:hypothetical protein D9756_001312 [Leucoagaricus leucothites]
MKLSTTFFALSLALNALATPLGSHAIFRRHTGIPARNARRYILQSRTDAPPACIAKASTASNGTDVPDFSNSTVTDPTATDVPTNSTTSDGTLGTVDPTGNSTDTSVIDSTGNSTDTSAIDNTGNSTDTSTIDSTGNSTDTSSVDLTGTGDNSTVPDTSNSTDTNTARRRRSFIHTSSGVTTETTTETLDIVDLAFEWQNLCLLSGGDIFVDDSPCVELAGTDGFNALLSDADPCSQQTFADSIITFAKSPGIVNKDALIAFALEYRRHPRTAVSILGVVPSSLYCMQAPINSELSGIVNAQPDGVNPGLFGSPNDPMVPFGSEGTCPFGTTADVSTCSCIPDSTDDSSVSALGDGSTDNSTVTDPLAATSTDDSTITDPSATASASDSTVTDPSISASADASTATDAATSTDDPIATDSAVSDAAAPTDSATAVDSNATDATPTAIDGSAPPAVTGAISGNVNDPNGRRSLK